MSQIERQQLQRRLFPTGIPRLWCPMLTHFQGAGVLDVERIGSHLLWLSKHVQGILVPGSTGEGWEMSDADIRNLLKTVLVAAHAVNIRVLVGVLKTSTAEVLTTLESLSDLLAHPAVAGITVCPAQGAGLSQSEIEAGLAEILKLGIPTALYQLPQITQNEMEAETVARLAAAFPNFILFKDTSGEDRVASAGIDLGGIFLVRGSERGGYARWYSKGGGPYHGFLLSTANVFAPELAEILALLDKGQIERAEQLSTTLEQIVGSAFEIVRDCSVGNSFTNANKILDHIRVHGDQAVKMPCPMLYSGMRLPTEYVQQCIQRNPALKMLCT